MSVRNTSIHNPEIYDLRLSGRAADLGFYAENALAAAGPVLELCCGTGRITIALAQRGVCVTALDKAQPMLERAREKAAAAGVSVEWILGDAASFALDRSFPLVLLPFGALQLFVLEAQVRSLFECIRTHLQHSGLLILDVPHVTQHAVDGRQPGGQYRDPESGELVTVEWDIVYDEARQVTHQTCYFSTADHTNFATDHLEMRWYFPEALDLLVRRSGFRIVEKLGHFDGRPFSRDCPLQIIIATPA